VRFETKQDCVGFAVVQIQSHEVMFPEWKPDLAEDLPIADRVGVDQQEWLPRLQASTVEVCFITCLGAGAIL
jgi:hypothetical protein